jgi:16S rRNA (uracil1498-N3)-methyltransferase
MHLFYQPDIKSGVRYLDEEESRHCVKVLRLKVGEEIMVLDGQGGKYTTAITVANHKKCEFEIIQSQQATPIAYHIHIAIAPTKNMDRIEWFVEKSVELGIQEISFFISDNSERKHFKTGRVIKKAVSAMKQSLKTHLPVINEPIKLKELLNQASLDDTHKFIAYVDQDNPDLLYKSVSAKNNYFVLIGPEGDFSSKELSSAIDNNFTKVSLGESRLRTETAGIAACHILNLVNGN